VLLLGPAKPELLVLAILQFFGGAISARSRPITTEI